MKINFHSITSKTLYLLIASATVFIVFVSWSANTIFTHSYNELEKEKIAIIEKNIAPSLALNISYGFEQAISEMALKTLENPHVLLIKLDAKGLTKTTYTNGTKTLKEYINSNEFISETQLIDPTTEDIIGKMTLVYSDDEYQNYMSDFNELFIIGLVLYIFGITLLSFLLYKSLQNLSLLANSLENFNPDNPKKLEFTYHFKDEIGSITSSANVMVENIIHYLNSYKMLNKKLSKNQSHLKDAQRLAHFGSWEYDIVKKTLNLSDEIYRILGINLNRNLTWDEFLSFVSSNHIDYVSKVFSNAIKNGSTFDITYPLLLENNKEIHIQTKGKVRNKSNGSSKITAVSMDITQDTINQKTIERLAYYDSLTNLPNRALLKDRIHKALQNAKRLNKRLAVLFLDLDHFKLINDTLGHDIGDELLKYIGKLFAKQIRESDTLSRIGGDEFVILLPNINSNKDAEIIAKKIITSLKGLHSIQSHQLYMSTSIGISIYPEHSTTMEDLITNADTAMYDAKQDGRNMYKFYSKVMGNHISRQMKIEQDLRKAVENKNELEIYYQAKVSADGQKILGTEALIRWNHPERGLVFPDEFIGVAESTGIILDMGPWIIEECAIQIQKWNNLGFTELHVAINLSARQFQDSSLVSFISNIITKYDLDPSKLEFEITESVTMSNMEATLRVLNDLKSIGVTIAIDDFGTGYSSLAYLKKFPIDTLKIDKSFIMDMLDDHEDKVIAQTIISMAHLLGYKTIAEGVETITHAKLLESMGCDQLQGYYFCKPIKKEEFTTYLIS